MTNNTAYLCPAIVSLISTLLTLLGLTFGYFRTHFNLRFLIIRHFCLLLQCTYFVVLAYWPQHELEDEPANWSIIFGFIYVLNQFSFFTVSWDIFSAFRKPFRTQKYALLIYLFPWVTAALLTIILSVDKSKFVYREKLGICWVKFTGNNTSLNPWNTVFFFIPSWLTAMTAGMTFCYVYWKLDVQEYIFCKRWHLYHFLKTERSSKINITFEVLVMFVGYMLFYFAVAFLYAAYYLFDDNNDSDKSTFFLFCVVMQGSFEFSLILLSNICLYRAKALPKFRHRSSSRIRSSKSEVQDNGYRQLQTDHDDNMSFEFFLQKVVMRQLESYIVCGEEQRDFHECLEITSYDKELFRNIRQRHGISDDEYSKEFRGISRKFQEVLDKQLDSGKGGASGAIFCPTQSKKFYLKKLEANEAKMLKNIIGDLAKIWIDRPTSLINRIFGLYSVTVMKVEVVFQVMEYIFYDMPPKKPTETYDLKGSEYKREVGSNPLAGDVLKDRDFRQPVLLADDMKSLLAEHLSDDIEFLASRNIMDYSLLVGILYEEQNDDAFSDRIAESVDLRTRINPFKKAAPGKTRKLTMYSFGIIDYLQEWNFYKQCESTAKSILNCEWGADESQISAVDPPKYRKRFEEKVLEKLFGGPIRKESHSTSRSINIDSTRESGGAFNQRHHARSPQGEYTGMGLA